jgi:hypothetical protein
MIAIMGRQPQARENNGLSLLVLCAQAAEALGSFQRRPLAPGGSSVVHAIATGHFIVYEALIKNCAILAGGA